MLFVCHPKFCISYVFSFSWGHLNSQEKLKTMPMQNFGVKNKEHYGMLWHFWSGQLLKRSDFLTFYHDAGNVFKFSETSHVCEGPEATL